MSRITSEGDISAASRSPSAALVAVTTLKRGEPSSSTSSKCILSDSSRERSSSTINSVSIASASEAERVLRTHRRLALRLDLPAVALHNLIQSRQRETSPARQWGAEGLEDARVFARKGVRQRIRCGFQNDYLAPFWADLPDLYHDCRAL